jgi:hypothetical protein
MRGNERVTLQRDVNADDEPRYEIQGEHPRPVDSAAVARLLRGLSEQTIVRDVPAPQDLKALGLLPPQLTLEFEQNGTVAMLSLGLPSRTSEQERYARLTLGEHSRVLVLSRSEASAVDVTPDSLVERRLLDWVPSDIAELTLQRGFELLRLKQLDNGRYLLNGETPQRAQRRYTEGLLLFLTQLAVGHDLDPRAARIEARDAKLVVTLQPVPERELSPVTLTFGGTCPTHPKHWLVEMKSATVRTGCVSPSELEQYPTDASFFVDKHLFFLHDDEVETLTVERPGSRFVLERQGSSFVLRAPHNEAVGLDAGNELLRRLTSTQGVLSGRCAPSVAVSSTTVTLRSGIVGKAGPTDEKLHIGAPLDGGTVPVCRDDGQQLLLTSEQAMALEVDPELLQSPGLLALPFDAIDELRIISPAGRQHLTTSDGIHLSLVEPKLPGDPASIETLKEQLAQLRAEHRLARKAYASRLQTPHTTVQFWASPADRPREKHELRLYGEERGLALATLDDREGPFLLSRTTAELLAGLLVDRSLYRLTATDHAFSLSRGKDQLRCERSQQGFVCPSRSIAEARLTRLVADLTELRALRVERAAAPRSVAPMTLSVYANAAGPPRFRLNVYLDTSVAGQEQVFAQAEGAPLRMTYEHETMKRLEAVLSNGALAP